MLFRRSLLQEFIFTASGTFLIMVGIVIAQRADYLVQLAAKGILPKDAIATILGFNIIRFMPLLLALSLFLAILLKLSRWYRDSEMVIWFSSGLSITKWIRPIFAFTIPIVIVIAFLSLFVTPWATNKVGDFRLQLESRDDLAAVSPEVFKESAYADRVFFVENFDDLGKIVKNIFVQSMQHQKLVIIVAAQVSRFVEKNGDYFLLMQRGRRNEGAGGTAEYSTTAFEKYAIRIEASEVRHEPPSTQSISSLELIQNKNNTSITELQWRPDIPVSAMILALLAIPLSTLDSRAGRSANFALAIVMYIVYNNLINIIQAWIAQGKVSGIIGLWPIHLAFALLVFYIFYRRTLQLPILPSMSLPSWLKMPTKAQS